MADEYDATRDAATQQEVNAIALSLEGCKSVLDVGVGTGRFAKPISELGFEVTGVDVSRRMLLKAREKGVDRTLLGDAYALPFREKTFDATVIIHVLHVVADWTRVMLEIERVTKGKVITIIKVTEAPRVSPTHGEGNRVDPNQGKAGGYPVRTQHRMWQNEQELKERIPPTKLERIRDEIVSLSVADALRRLDAKHPIGANLIPPEMKRAMMERMIAMSGSQVVHRRIVEDLAVWDADQLKRLTG